MPSKKIDLMKRIEMEKKSSMLNWWFNIIDLNNEIPMPDTLIYELTLDELKMSYNWIDNGELATGIINKVIPIANKIRYPLFLRTDLSSSKHRFANTCYVPAQYKFPMNLRNLFEDNQMAGIFGLPYRAIGLRKYIEMNLEFDAFNGLLISPERRYFVNDGEILCHHPYWPEDSIKFYGNGEPDNWKLKLANMNKENPNEIKLLSTYARKIAKRLKGSWSVDFCQARGGIWYFIDCALAEVSYHPPCDNKPKE